MAVRCPVCYGMDLSYAGDGWATCRACGARSAPTWAATLAPTPAAAESAGTSPGHGRAAVRWRRALAYGSAATLLGAVLWGAAIWFRGYLLGFVAIPIALLVAFGLERGAGRADGKLPVLAGGLTMAAVFLGELIFLLLLFSDGKLGPIDLPADYVANLVARSTLPSYVFAGGGAVVAAAYLRDRGRARGPRGRSPKGSADAPRS